MSVGPATFIVGHPRSGTSLLRALLDSHPGLNVLPFETHLFDWATKADPTAAVLERTRLWSTLNAHRPDVPRAEVEDALRHAFSGTTAVRERLVALVRAWAGLAGVDPGLRWVEKTPRHLYELPVFLRWFGPETRVLVLERDPRDVMASQLKQDPTRSIFAMALTCRVAHRAAEAWRSSGEVLTVRYADLAAGAPAVMGEVCDFLGIQRLPAVERPTVMGDAYGGNSRFQQSLDGVSTRPVGRYRESLSPSQIRRVEALLRDELAAMGHEPVSDGPGGHLLQRLALDVAVGSGLWRSRGFRRALRGG